MKHIFKTKEFLNELDRMEISYKIDYNPSPEKIERIKKSIEKRNSELKRIQEDYRTGKLQLPL